MRGAGPGEGGIEKPPGRGGVGECKVRVDCRNGMGRQETGRRLADRQGGWQEAGRRLAGGWQEAGRQGDWQETRRQGDWQEAGGAGASAKPAGAYSGLLVVRTATIAQHLGLPACFHLSLTWTLTWTLT